MNLKKTLTCLVILMLCFKADQIFAGSLSDMLEEQADIVVDINGSGDYTTVQQGINAVPDHNEKWLVILVKKGVYREKVILSYKKTKVIIVGEDVDSTMIIWDDYGNKVLPGHTFSTYTFRADANDFQAYNLTFCNPTTKGQGVAYHSNGDRQILFHCRLIGNQDTYFDNFRTRRYIRDCYIEGTVDYIFGCGVTVFDSCQIHSKRDKGYITASSTPQHYEFGHVFKNCLLTSADHVYNVSLGRPWFPYANTIFFECWLPESIIKEGWSPWNGREEHCVYREYNCFGPGADMTARAEFAKPLDPAMVYRYSIDTIFSADNFPSDLGFTADTSELMLMYRRFEASGYPERADTVLYAGRDHYPEYPSDNWSPEFYQDIFGLIRKHTIPFLLTDK